MISLLKVNTGSIFLERCFFVCDVMLNPWRKVHGWIYSCIHETFNRRSPVEERCRRSNMKIKLMRSWNPGLGGGPPSPWWILGMERKGFPWNFWKVKQLENNVWEEQEHVRSYFFSSQSWLSGNWIWTTNSFFWGAAFPFWLIVGMRGIFFFLQRICWTEQLVLRLYGSTGCPLQLTTYDIQMDIQVTGKNLPRLVIVQVLGPPVLGVGVPGHNLMTARCDPSSLALGEIFRRCQWPSKCMSLWCRPCRSRSKCHKCNMPLGERFTLR